MGTQQLLFIILGVILLGIAIAAGITMFNAQVASFNRDSIISDLNELAAHAYAFRGMLRSMGGGQGDYSTYSIPTVMATNGNATYTILNASVNSLIIQAVSAQDPSNTVQVLIGADGKLQNWTYAGDFQ
ncbi:MAG: hypothetical protein AABZ02_07335 [Bacteroidota bacterium]